MLLTILIFIIVLSLLVFVHELGHYWTAKKFGAKAEEFGFGFPPRLCGWKVVNGKRKFFRSNQEEESEKTIWSINWIPIGGFVKIKGENGDDKTDPESFASKKIWQRAIILSAGVAMNVVLVTICLSIAFMLGAPQVIDEQINQNVIDPKIQVLSVLPDSPASETGLAVGDVIESIDNNTFANIDELKQYISSQESQELHIVISRLGETKEFTIMPAQIAEADEPAIGVGLVKTGIVSYPWYESIWLGLKGTVSLFVQIITAFALLIKNAIMGQPATADLAGPVGIAVITGRVARMGFSYLLQFTALLSMNLAIINFLPLPALDGGRVLFLFIEKIRGKAINQKIEGIVHTIGFALLMILVFVVTSRDIWKFRDYFINLWHKIL